MTDSRDVDAISPPGSVQRARGRGRRAATSAADRQPGVRRQTRVARTSWSMPRGSTNARRVHALSCYPDAGRIRAGPRCIRRGAFHRSFTGHSRASARLSAVLRPHPAALPQETARGSRLMLDPASKFAPGGAVTRPVVFRRRARPGPDMDKLKIVGGMPLQGEIPISGERMPRCAPLRVMLDRGRPGVDNVRSCRTSRPAQLLRQMGSWRSAMARSPSECVRPSPSGAPYELVKTCARRSVLAAWSRVSGAPSQPARRVDRARPVEAHQGLELRARRSTIEGGI